jgi:hypothetical protein
LINEIFKSFAAIAEVIDESLSVPGAEFELEVWHVDHNSSVQISEIFVLKRSINRGFLPESAFKIWSNGFLHLENTAEPQEFGPAEYGIMNLVKSIILFIF